MKQKPIGNFTIDFYCSKLKLAIEIDGDSHGYELEIERDKKKDKYLNKLGIHVLRIDDLDVKEDMSFVLELIADWIQRNS